jgi:hypothetical protein
MSMQSYGYIIAQNIDANLAHKLSSRTSVFTVYKEYPSPLVNSD